MLSSPINKAIYFRVVHRKVYYMMPLALLCGITLLINDVLVAKSLSGLYWLDVINRSFMVVCGAWFIWVFWFGRVGFPMSIQADNNRVFVTTQFRNQQEIEWTKIDLKTSKIGEDVVILSYAGATWRDRIKFSLSSITDPTVRQFIADKLGLVKEQAEGSKP